MGYVLRPDLRTCKALGGAMQLLVANRWDIRRVFLSNNRYNAIVKGLHNAIALDYHYRKSLLFWSDVSTDVIKVAFLNGTRVRDVIKWGLESPGGVAVDWIHDLLFWTDSGTRRVEASNFQGNLRVVIAANDLDKPRAIVAHPGDAMVFWSDWGKYSFDTFCINSIWVFLFKVQIQKLNALLWMALSVKLSFRKVSLGQMVLQSTIPVVSYIGPTPSNMLSNALTLMAQHV